MTSYGGATRSSSGPAFASSYRSARNGRTSATNVKLPSVSAIADLAEDRVVEAVYAVARKRRLQTRAGGPYLALELVDPSGRIDARGWNDVELLDPRFAGGDAVRVLPRLRVDLLVAAALVHDVGRTLELGRGPTFEPTAEGRLLGHVHLGLRLVEERAAALEAEGRAEPLHAIPVHHDARAARP